MLRVCRLKRVVNSVGIRIIATSTRTNVDMGKQLLGALVFGINSVSRGWGMQTTASIMVQEELGTITAVIHAHAAERPAATALIQGDRSMTYTELNRLIDRIARHMARAPTLRCPPYRRELSIRTICGGHKSDSPSSAWTLPRSASFPHHSIRTRPSCPSSPRFAMGVRSF